MKQHKHKRASLLPFNHGALRRCIQLLMAFTMPVILAGCHLFEEKDDDIEMLVVQVPAGFKIEKVASGLQLVNRILFYVFSLFSSMLYYSLTTKDLKIP